EEAREMNGMRLIVAEGLPGPWAEGIKGILDVKKIPYVCGRFEVGGDHSTLIDWSAQASVPVIAYNDEHPKSNWAEQLYLAERIAPEPRLIPADVTERREMFGLCNELCAMHGFAWNRRLLLVDMGLNNPDLGDDDRAFFQGFGAKYGYSPEAAKAAKPKVVEVLNLLTNTLKAQQARGKSYFIGDHLTALDIYWSGMSHLIEPIAEDKNPMIPDFRPMYQNYDPDIAAAAADTLMPHRDFIYEEHLGLPMDLFHTQ
ncbi:MAG: hypothetical protein AAF384_13260, partial [Pseudomonadota bacterium]